MQNMYLQHWPNIGSALFGQREPVSETTLAQYVHADWVMKIAIGTCIFFWILKMKHSL